MDPILLHQQLRENTEDLSKYMKDLNVWEKEMKRKEKEIYGDGNDGEADEDLPPVRSKIKKNCANTATRTDNTAAKTDNTAAKTEKQTGNTCPSPPRIKSNDYSAWEKFDVEKACEEVEKVCVASPPKSSPAPASSDSDPQEAIYEKENGNKFVKLGKWKEAMDCYSRAISHDASNAIFYANRAQCALKLNMWQHVVDDCGKALAIEPGYVKALLRRGTAHMKLHNYSCAIDDLRGVIKLEPGNKEARTALSTSIKAKATQKSSGKTPPKNDNVIVAISKPQHLRSKAPLRRVPVEEIGANIPKPPVTEVCVEGPQTPTITEVDPLEGPNLDRPHKQPTIVELDPPLQASNVPKPIPKPSTPSKSTKLKPSVMKSDFVETVPPAPKSSVQFMQAWGQLRPHLRYAYLQQLQGSDLSRIFGDSLESKMLSELLAALATAPPKSPIFDYLEGLTQTRRFSTLTLFMSSSDRKGARSLLATCLSEKQCTPKQMENLVLRYEL